MRKLTPKMQAFVLAVLEHPEDINYTRAAKMAGFACNTDNSATSTAYRLAHDERVQEAIQEEARKRIGASAVMAASELVNIAANGSNEKVRLRAVEMILNRAGLHARTEHKVTVETQEDTASTIKKIKALAEVLGVDAEKLLGANSLDKPVIEGEFQNVYDEEKAEYSTEGLEDLL
jgi:phage terminase small subunit